MIPELSFVIPLWNKELTTIDFTQRAIDSIHEFTKEMSYEIILVDNRSPAHEQRSMSWLREQVYQECKVIALPQNIGFGAACNLGFRLARGQYLICMNSDAAQVEDTPSILKRAMHQYHLSVAMPEHWEACMGPGLKKSEQVMGEWYFGAYWMSTRDFIVNVMEGFDEEYYELCYYEDWDLWSRCFSRGYKVAGFRGTWVKHHGNASALPNLNELYLKNRERYVKRWGDNRVIRTAAKQLVAR